LYFPELHFRMCEWILSTGNAIDDVDLFFIFLTKELELWITFR
jgi:hypothetical protein